MLVFLAVLDWGNAFQNRSVSSPAPLTWEREGEGQQGPRSGVCEGSYDGLALREEDELATARR